MKFFQLVAICFIVTTAYNDCPQNSHYEIFSINRAHEKNDVLVYYAERNSKTYKIIHVKDERAKYHYLDIELNKSYDLILKRHDTTNVELNEHPSTNYIKCWGKLVGNVIICPDDTIEGLYMLIGIRDSL